MSRRSAALFVAGVLLFTLALVGFWWWSREPEGETAQPTGRPFVERSVDASLVADLYFPGSGGRLYAESREVAIGGRIEEQIAILINELLRGPEGISLYPPLPSGVEVAGVHLLADGIAYIDLTLPEDPGALSWGSKREILAVYSLVDSIVLNFSEVEAVILLWNGRQQPTFAGHLDTTRPLVANRALLAPGTP
ncbi:MAG: GerMN domain-containing protein [Thermoanaerobaculia bacterium]